MRGEPYPIPIPDGGVDYSKPPHLLSPNQLADGENVFVDIDGLLKTRKGYVPLVADGPGARIQGGLNYQNANLDYQSVIATTTGWWALSGSNWVDITDPANPLTGFSEDAARFAVFSQGGDWYALGVNNSDLVRSWKTGDATYSVLGSAPVGRDILTLASRVLVFNTIESSVRYPRRVRWSSFEDRTTWGTNNFNDMLDSDDFLIGARKLGALSAAAYGGRSIWVIQSNSGGDDASAFTAEPVFAADGYSGPVSPSAIVVAEGVHYYLASNGHVYAFNGIQPSDISGPIAPEILRLINFNSTTRAHGIYLPMKRALVFFFPSVPNADCMTAIYFDLVRGIWQPPFTFTEPITASWQGTFEQAQTWANDPYTWANSPYTWETVPDLQELASFIGTSAGQVHAFFQSINDNGALIPYSASGPLFTADPSMQYAVDRAEFYLQPSIVDESLTFEFDGYGAPLQPSAPLVSFGVELGPDGDSWVNMMVEPGPLNPNNQYANFLQVTASSLTGNGAFVFAGGVLYLNGEKKGDYSRTRISS